MSSSAHQELLSGKLPLWIRPLGTGESAGWVRPRVTGSNRQSICEVQWHFNPVLSDRSLAASITAASITIRRKRFRALLTNKGQRRKSFARSSDHVHRSWKNSVFYNLELLLVSLNRKLKRETESIEHLLRYQETF